MESRAEITVRNKLTGKKMVYRLDQDRVTVGRDQANFIVLDDRMISRRHAEIMQEGSQFFIRDLKSNNGTSLNHQALAPQEKTLLRSGDTIQLNDYDLYFQIPTGKSQDLYETTDTDILEVKMVKKLLKAMDKEKAPSVEVLEGPHAGKRFVLDEKNQDVVIGRDPACEFSIESDVLSRRHARLEKRFDTVILHDLQSKNGTFVNREKITEKKLQDGDVIHLGTLLLNFRNPQELAFDLEPPKLEAIKKVAVETIEEPSPSSENIDAEIAPEFAPTGSRGSRKRGTKIEKKRKKEEPIPIESQPEEFPMDEPPPEEMPMEQQLVEEGFQEEGDMPEEMEPAGRFRFSTSEIITIAIGAVVLIGSLWALIKIF